MSDKPIMIISKDAVMRRVLQEALATYDAGAVPLVAASVEEAQGESVRTILLALPLGMGGGAENISRLKEKFSGVPIIAVLPQGAAGADDCGLNTADIFTMPLRIGALLDRLRRHRSGMAAVIAEEKVFIGPHVLLAEEGKLLLEGQEGEVRLTEKECDILHALHHSRGRTVNRKDLLEQVWGYAEGVETHTLETHIYRLRQKLEKDPANPVLLLTEEAGYRLV